MAPATPRPMDDGKENKYHKPWSIICWEILDIYKDEPQKPEILNNCKTNRILRLEDGLFVCAANHELGTTCTHNLKHLVTAACSNPMTRILATMNAPNFKTNKRDCSVRLITIDNDIHNFENQHASAMQS